jgi:hypothetical protein
MVLSPVDNDAVERGGAVDVAFDVAVDLAF